MAKLIAIVSRAVWLVVALAAIVHSTQAGGFFSSSKKVKDPRERNDDDWKKLGVACAKSVEEIENDTDMIKFFSELKVVSKQTDCSEKIRRDITDYLLITRGTKTHYNSKHGLKSLGTRGHYAECFKLMREYLPLYLDECGYEESFRKTVEIMKEKSHERFSFTQHKTLISYIEETFLDSLASIRLLDWLLGSIENISKLERMSVETYCTQELHTDSIDLLFGNIYRDDVRREFERVKIAFYLDKCGYEKLLSDRVEHMKQVSGGHWDSEKYPTLYSYFAAVLSKNKSLGETVLTTWLTKILSMMRELPALESISNETLCADQPKDTFLADLKFTSSEAPLLYDLYEDYFTLYSNKCRVDEPLNN